MIYTSHNLISILSSDSCITLLQLMVDECHKLYKLSGEPLLMKIKASENTMDDVYAYVVPIHM